VSGFDYIESPLIESILGISTLNWYNSLCAPRSLDRAWAMCWHRGAAVLYLVMGAVFMGRWLGVDGGVAYIKTLHYPNLHCMSFSIYVSLSYKKFSEKW
jgi:hypothetical protein